MKYQYIQCKYNINKLIIVLLSILFVYSNKLFEIDDDDEFEIINYYCNGNNDNDNER